MAKILLVEDDKNLREIYGVRLMAEGYQIVSSGDGEEALAVAIKERPDLIISDVMMPKISGFDMLDILRQTAETKNIKVIMMTALSSEDQRARGESLGADRYLVKSQVGIEDVVRTVHEVIGDIPAVQQPTTFPSSAPAPAPQPVAPIPAPVAEVPQPAPMPQPAPAPVAMPEPPAPAPVQPMMPPATPMPAAPAPQPVAAPVPAPQPVAPMPQPAPAPVAMPEPIAPFSTPSPSQASVGERVIQPLAPTPSPAAAPITDIASQMQAELQSITPPAPAGPVAENPQQPQPPLQ